MLTEEGKEVARECLLRSGLTDSSKSLGRLKGCSTSDGRDRSTVDIQGDLPELEGVVGVSVEKEAPINVKKPKKSIDVPPEYFDKVYSGSCYFTFLV